MLSLPLVLSPATHPTPYCPVTVWRDYTFGVAYYAVVLRDSECTPRQVARVRKASTLNKGAAYRPILPLKGAWTLTWDGDNIPANTHWTSFTWVWEYWDGKTWQAAETR